MVTRDFTAKLLFVLLCLSLSALSQAAEIMRWDRTPLRIGLPVGAERIIEMDRNVRIGLPPTIANPEVLRVQSAGGVLYMKAHEAFDVERVRLQDIETGEVFLFDLYADNSASDEPIRIIYEATSRTHTDRTQSSATRKPSSSTPGSVPNDVASRVSEAMTGQRSSQALPAPIVLTRYAAQSLYAPLRTIESVPGIARAPMRLPESITTLLPAYPFEVKAVAGWQYQGYEVTAFQIRNLDAQRSFQMDPRHLQGRFYSATFMHETLKPAGYLEDSTTLFLVTKGRIAESLIGGGQL